MAKRQNNDNTKGWWGCAATGTLAKLLVGMQNCAATLNDNLAVSYKTKHTLNHTIQHFLHSWIFTQMSKRHVQSKTCTPMFIVASLTVAKMWKEPRCPSIVQRIKQALVYSYNGIIFSNIKQMNYEATKRHGRTLYAYW